MHRPAILFLTSGLSSFVEGDLRMLKASYPVRVVATGGGPTGNFGQRLSLVHSILSGVLRTDIVFAWFAHNHSYLAVMAVRLLRKKSLVVVGGYEVANEPEIGYGALLDPAMAGKVRYIIENADCILAVSEFSRREILAVAEPRRIETIYNGIDTSLFSPEGSKENIVLTVCLVSTANIRVKGLDTFMDAARQIPEARFVLISRALDGALEILKRDAPANVEFVGAVGQAELIGWYRRAKVYCQLSYRESFGVALAEAMSCECVPVVTDRGALPEVAGDTGFVVPYADTHVTADAISQALVADTGSAARKRICELFSREQREQELRRIIATLQL
ncbi:D-inositol 3-phosphate glycosyltransferase [Methanoculleus chikugoensis]|jgi:glycosyltransferase involved in cell wall biosynthesis|uniref:D-inositol 3-phosphate glycosyltransferase n=2 Tax=Methanoculleus chikugoensis TaxID=118126 RepID=A0A1M4MLR3_9EURY|nr:glycosyltransferase family 4 protein [Methanomicrobiales archaeon]SCL75806.1 D-inositol 3-phosphate glycosyltransferase [Methanoculleus chikugoensis]